MLIAGATLSVLGGGGLIVPNPYLPDAVRWAHLVEVGVSNFVYGAFIGWLLTSPRATAAVAQPQAAAGV